MIELLVPLLIVAAFWLMFGWSGPKPHVPPITREHVLAKVMLHQTRRRRELAELERSISDSADQRLADLYRDDWLER